MMIDILSFWNWQLDGWIVATGVCCAVASAVLGNFLVLRRMSMLGDAITHAVLPGLAIAFLVTGERNSVSMFVGAVIIGVLTALLTEWIRQTGNVDEGASMGVVFTSLFALGLVMIVRAADHVDLDPGCVLYGSIELTPLDRYEWSNVSVPKAFVTLAAVGLINIGFVCIFFKELKITSFDPTLATTLGIHAKSLHYVLMTLVAVTAVASFESVGNILVVAMFIVPPATAYMLTDRLSPMIVGSVIVGGLSAIIGHIAAIVVPAQFGFRSTTTSGMMALTAGLFLACAIAFSPKHGLIIQVLRRRMLAIGILSDDVVSLLYRLDERTAFNTVRFGVLRQMLLADRISLWLALVRLRVKQRLTQHRDGFQLTRSGKARAKKLVRSHRLWEQYLVAQAGLDVDRIHEKAELFEHYTDFALRDRLDREMDKPEVDPHGSPIPSEGTD